MLSSPVKSPSRRKKGKIDIVCILQYREPLEGSLQLVISVLIIVVRKLRLVSLEVLGLASHEELLWLVF